MHVLRLSILCVAAMSSGCASSTVTSFKPVASRGAELKRDQLVGSWYGDMRTERGGTRRWLTNRKHDGTYRVDFVVIEPDGATLRQSEFGDWGVSGEYFLNITRGLRDRSGRVTTDKASSYFWDVYKILRFDGTHLIYRNVSSRNKFSVRRVDSSFVIAETPDRAMQRAAR